MTRGECRICGCTYENACAGGCSWADAKQTLCSSCVETADDLLAALEENAQRGVTRPRLDRFLETVLDRFRLSKERARA